MSFGRGLSVALDLLIFGPFSPCFSWLILCGRPTCCYYSTHLHNVMWWLYTLSSKWPAILFIIYIIVIQHRIYNGIISEMYLNNRTFNWPKANVIISHSTSYYKIALKYVHSSTSKRAQNLFLSSFFSFLVAFRRVVSSTKSLHSTPACITFIDWCYTQQQQQRCNKKKGARDESFSFEILLRVWYCNKPHWPPRQSMTITHTLDAISTSINHAKHQKSCAHSLYKISCDEATWSNEMEIYYI